MVIIPAPDLPLLAHEFCSLEHGDPEADALLSPTRTGVFVGIRAVGSTGGKNDVWCSNFARRISLTLSHQFNCVSQSVIFDPQYDEFREKLKTVDVMYFMKT